MNRLSASLFLLLLLLAGSPLFAQPKAIIRGKISKPLSEQVTVVTYPSLLVHTEVETEATLTGNEFRLEVPVTKAGLAELVHGSEVVTVYLEPGFELNLTANGDKLLKTVKFAGAGANENNYLAQYGYNFEEFDQYQVLPDNIKLREKDFVEFLESRKQEQLRFLERYTAKNPVSDAFRRLAQTEIEYGYANDRITYFDLREQMVRSENRLTPSANYFHYLQELDMQREQNLLSPAFVGFLSNYTTHLAKAAGKTDTNPDYYTTRYTLAKQKLAGQVQALALSQVLKQSLLKGQSKQSEELLADFQTVMQEPEVLAYFRKLYNENKQLATGSLAPDFKLLDAQGKEVSLSDFKGRLVYLNFWSTNCGMCLNDMPYLQELHKNLSGQPVVFISVGMDDDEEAWRNTVSRRNLPGVQLYKSLSPDVIAEYGIKELPAYFLIDEAGNVLSAKPKRPTDRDAETELLRILNSGQAAAR
ncbi:TlpA family protein disulfide reductase [Pontibacter beigongshangensis]|uniref:TlpA family protein disulfide reductase n=1 Tax=Pontibacter beigongshangensis TaxID=2574733 RepID=UPI00165098B0|nr:TlpA disulfide reductase family protein [Pontibacter beigongshangensis]